ncbi:hypothetical protein FRC08_000026 [Ceratobasidium sp. 394]|nr:hypothetical protein FRC08_000026 [Ceratobasidium sp. 394]KAG9100739.1 hypothetical protein FS749_013236 [Ceratobasidium sp. UAMH 11750]
MSMSKTYDLFGGAITITLPSNLIDASDLRQVPDTQEVLLSPESEVSIVVEILECVEPDDPHEVAKFHFDALAHDNDVVVHPEGCTVQQIIVPTPATPINSLVSSVLHGTQLVPKFNRTQPDTVKIFLAVYRVHEKNIDVTLVFNVPVEAEKEGSAVTFGGDVYNAWVNAFEEAVGTFKVVDYGLFA